MASINPLHDQEHYLANNHGNQDILNPSNHDNASQEACNLSTLYDIPELCIIATDPLTESLDVAQVVEHSGATDLDPGDHTVSLQDAYALQIEPNAQLDPRDSPGGSIALSTLASTNYGQPHCTVPVHQAPDVQEFNEVSVEHHGVDLQLGNHHDHHYQHQSSSLLVEPPSVQTMHSTISSSVELLCSSQFATTAQVQGTQILQTDSFVPKQEIHRVVPGPSVHGKSRMTANVTKRLDTVPSLSKDSVAVENRSRPLWIVRPSGTKTASTSSRQLAEFTEKSFIISPVAENNDANVQQPGLVGFVANLHVKAECPEVFPDPVPDIIAAETVVMTTPQLLKQPDVLSADHADPNIILGDILVGENLEISDAILPPNHLLGSGPGSSTSSHSFPSLTCATSTYTMVAPPLKESSLREVSKRERDRIKKRTQRENPEYRLREKEKGRERMRQARLDPSYRDTERRKDKVRRHMARRHNEPQRLIEKERDRAYQRNRRIRTIENRTENSLDQLLKQGIVFALS